MGIRSQNSRSRTVLSEINVTPFVDVMLVLLVIFMVTAPILYQGIDINLPKTSSQQTSSSQTNKNIIITINRDGELFMENKRYDLSEIKLKIRNSILDKSKKSDKGQIFIRADSSVFYGKVVEVINEIKKSGVQNIGLITEPDRTNKIHNVRGQ